MTEEEKKLHLVTDRRISKEDVEPETDEQRAERETRERHQQESKDRHPSGYKLPSNAATDEEIEQLAAEHAQPQEGRPVHTAFLVITELDGSVHVDPDVSQQLVPSRLAHFYDFIGGCHNVITDVEASKNAQVSLNHQMMMAQQLHKQAQDAELGAQVQQELNRRKGGR